MPNQKSSKANARYTDNGSAQEHCAICQFFVPPYLCSKVGGAISPQGWSRFFKKKSGL